jgi:hypothetical protein
MKHLNCNIKKEKDDKIGDLYKEFLISKKEKELKVEEQIVAIKVAGALREEE